MGAQSFDSPTSTRRLALTLPARGREERRSIQCRQGLREVRHQIVGMLDADGDADGCVAHAEPVTGRLGNPRMGGGGRVRDQGFGSPRLTGSLKAWSALSTPKASGSP